MCEVVLGSVFEGLGEECCGCGGDGGVVCCVGPLEG